MAKNDNPFAIRKSPVSIITVQALTLDDYVQRTIDDRDGVSFCATTNKKYVPFYLSTIMAKNDNPFGIRKSPVEIISAQALSLDDYVKRGEFGTDFHCRSGVLDGTSKK